MRPPEVYVDLDGQALCLGHLDAGERKLLERMRRRAARNPDWNEFDNYWTVAVPAFYQARGLPRKAVPQTILWQIAADLSGRIAVAAGLARIGDYRDELEQLIQSTFPSRRAFCKAAGLSEDMLSHVLKGRKHLSLESLTRALERIGYKLRILPAVPGEPLPQALGKRGKRAARSA
ncbi:MAG TPA: hypothetical protein VGY66_28765 [Gemmataceae bacterium]|jgi:hypothetical protein|nr:hypothetical protein [Gemmataceae bacterium]